MSELPVLVIGDKTVSSWSLRPWLALRQADIAFEERLLWLHRPAFRSEVARYSPSGRVPVLLHDGAVVWESLAILEYINETWLQGRGWPAERAARAHARAIAGEMHSGFAALRRELTLNLRRHDAPLDPGHDAAHDLLRIVAIWEDARARFGAGGPFLFGTFGAADIVYAPVVSRFISYQIPVPGFALAYMQAVWEHDWMKQWIAASENEEWVIEQYETAANA